MFNNKLKHNNNIQQCSKSKTLYIKSSYKASSISTIATSLELNENKTNDNNNKLTII